jgi:hypothetical protein
MQFLSLRGPPIDRLVPLGNLSFLSSVNWQTIKKKHMIATTFSRISADDFFTGFFAALAVKRCKTVSRRGLAFDRALAETFAEFQKRAAEKDIDLGFRIRLNPVHGDSVAVRDGIATAARRDLVSLDNPIYQNIRLKLSEDEGHELLARLPGGEPLFSGLAESFLDHYENQD